MKCFFCPYIWRAFNANGEIAAALRANSTLAELVLSRRQMGEYGSTLRSAWEYEMAIIEETLAENSEARKAARLAAQLVVPGMVLQRMPRLADTCLVKTIQRYLGWRDRAQ